MNNETTNTAAYVGAEINNFAGCMPGRTHDTPAIDPGEGYRLLRKGEGIEEGDECYICDGGILRRWMPTAMHGYEFTGENGQMDYYRRRITATDTPASVKWKLKAKAHGGSYFVSAGEHGLADCERATEEEARAVAERLARALPGKTVRVLRQVVTVTADTNVTLNWK